MQSDYLVQNWLPIDSIFNCEGVLDDYEGFRVLVRGNDRLSPMYRISFDAVVAYSSVEESSCFNDQKRAPGLCAKGSCFIVQNSWYLSELHEISSCIRKGYDILYHSFYGKRLTELDSNM